MRIFADTSVPIEYLKGTKTELLETLFEKEFEVCINTIVLSEFLFHFLTLKGQKSPLTLKVSGKIGDLLNDEILTDFLLQFTFIPDSSSVVNEVPLMMKKYNLLPSDALILASCMHYLLSYLASYDTTDFQTVCTQEDIILVSDSEKAKQILH